MSEKPAKAVFLTSLMSQDMKGCLRSKVMRYCVLLMYFNFFMHYSQYYKFSKILTDIGTSTEKKLSHELYEFLRKECGQYVVPYTGMTINCCICNAIVFDPDSMDCTRSIGFICCPEKFLCGWCSMKATFLALMCPDHKESPVRRNYYVLV